MFCKLCGKPCAPQFDKCYECNHTKTVKELAYVPFIKCMTQCATMVELGISECENVCPWKFDVEDEYIDPITIVPAEYKEGGK